MKNIIFIFLIGFISFLYADTSLIEKEIKTKNFAKAKVLLEKNNPRNIELWRELGYSYKEVGDLKNAIFCYKKIFKIDSEDYDAELALARLYLQTNELYLSKKYFQMILDNDITDVEALLGLARIQKKKENYSKSIVYYQTALKYLPDNIPIILEIAEVYLDANKLDLAERSYKKINKIDDTWSEAWSGIGKILWWKNQPFSAKKYYEKALELDPENKEIVNEFRKVKDSIKWNLSATFSFQKEIEDTYEIKSYNQKYLGKKRFSDKLFFTATSFWQYADKNESGLITKRYYDSSYLKTDWEVYDGIKVNFSIGGSLTDSTLTVLDGGLFLSHNFNFVKVNNNLNFGNEYFYYWEKVRRNYIKEKFILNFEKVDFQTDYQIGKIEKNYILDKSEISENTFLDYNFSLKYRFGKIAKLSAGAVYRYIDYAYYSSLYYSPIDRKIYGLTGSLYYPFKKTYLYFDCSVNQDNSNIWETNYDTEIGFSIKKISISFSYSEFKNKYYQNNNLSLTIGGDF